MFEGFEEKKHVWFTNKQLKLKSVFAIFITKYKYYGLEISIDGHYSTCHFHVEPLKISGVGGWKHIDSKTLIIKILWFTSCFQSNPKIILWKLWLESSRNCTPFVYKNLNIFKKVLNAWLFHQKGPLLIIFSAFMV